MRRARWVLLLGLAVSVGGCGSPGACRSVDLAPVPASASPRFAVLAVNENRTRLEISLISAANTLVEIPHPDDASVRSSVWLTHATPLRGTGLAGGIGADARLPWTPVRDDRLIVLSSRGGRAIVDIPFSAEGIVARATEPALAGRDDAIGGEVIDLAGGVYALRTGGVADGVPFDDNLALLDREGGRIVARIPLGAALRGPATPRRMALITDPRTGGTSDRILVGVDRILPSPVPGDPPEIGPGAVLVVDPAARQVSRVIDIPELRRCGEVALVPPDAGDASGVRYVIVGCAGIPDVTGDPGRTAGLALVRVRFDPERSEAAPVIALERTFFARDPSSVPSRGLIALPGAVAIAVADGVENRRDDVAFLIDLARGGPPARIASAPVLADRASGLGTGAYDERSQVLALPVGRSSVQILRVHRREGETTLEDVAFLEVCNHLVVRSVRVVGAGALVKPREAGAGGGADANEDAGPAPSTEAGVDRANAEMP
jgi:hypothetical protein